MNASRNSDQYSHLDHAGFRLRAHEDNYHQKRTPRLLLIDDLFNVQIRSRHDRGIVGLNIKRSKDSIWSPIINPKCAKIVLSCLRVDSALH